MVFAVLAIACGVWGFSFTLALAAQRLQPGWIYALVLVIAATYALGVWSGVALLERSGRWLLLNRLFWFLQVPALAALLAGHSIDSGALVSEIGVSEWLAHRSDFSLIRDMPVVLGLNLFALAACGYFCWMREAGTQASAAMKPEARA